VKFLVVDDSDVIRRAIERTIARKDDEIRSASNGVEALNVIASYVPDAITMDISMPEMDGLSCIEGILQTQPAARILVISALKDKPTAVEAVRRGAQGFLLKPFSAADLRTEIAELMT
jgi:two-component system chemotaxis response regulator CheY